jgi:hypothetical protein
MASVYASAGHSLYVAKELRLMWGHGPDFFLQADEPAPFLSGSSPGGDWQKWFWLSGRHHSALRTEIVSATIFAGY